MIFVIPAQTHCKLSFCAERSASSCAKSQDVAIYAAVDEDAPYGFRDFARNDEIMGLRS